MSNIELIPGIMNFTLGNGLAIYQGSTWQVPVTVCECVNDEFVPVSIEGLIGRASIRSMAGSKQSVANPSVVIEDALQGIFTLNLTDEETMAIPTTGETFRETTTYQYDVYFEDEEGKAYRTLQGFVEVSPTVTEA